MAATINFRKMVQADASHVLEALMEGPGMRASICDGSRRPLLGDPKVKGPGEFPVWLGGRTVGWVLGPAHAYGLALALTYMAEKELEKKEITEKALDRESEINLLQEITEKVGASLDVAEIAMTLVDEITGVIEATGASVMLLDDQTQRLEIAAAFGKKFEDRPVLKPGIGIVGDVLLTGVPEIVNDVAQDPRYVRSAYPLCSLICVPIATRDKIIGALNVSNSKPMNYGEQEVKLALTLASQAALAIVNARRFETAAQGAEAPQGFAPDGILQWMGSRGKGQDLPREVCREQMTVLFAGMRSYAEHYAAMSPQENFQFLNEYLASIAPPVTEHGGFLGKCIGDGVMALFPDDGGASSERAVRAAMAMHERLRDFSEKRRKASRLPVAMGVGIHTGPVSLGVVGLKDSRESMILGDSVAIAAKLERLSKLYGLKVAISGGVYDSLPSKSVFGIREIDMVQIPGRESVFTVYDVFSAEPAGIQDTKRQNQAAFHDALDLFRSRQWEEAARIFDRLQKLMPFDRVITIHLKRCLAFIKSPPGEAWVGVSRLSEF